ncbi:hypothetical protein [Ureaplasma urealyticum]|nr:hypothetical protein [Ureaplasma urealyticum]
MKNQLNYLKNENNVLTVVAEFKSNVNNQLDDGEYFISKLFLNKEPIKIKQNVYKPSGLQLDGTINNEKPTYLMIPTTFSRWTNINIFDTEVIRNNGIPKQLKIKYDDFVNEHNYKQDELNAMVELTSTKTNKKILLSSIKFDDKHHEIVFDLTGNKQLQNIILENPVFKIKNLSINNDLQVLDPIIKQKELDLANKHIPNIGKFLFNDNNQQNISMIFQLDSDSSIIKNARKITLMAKKVLENYSYSSSDFTFNFVNNEKRCEFFYNHSNKQFLLNIDHDMRSSSKQIFENDSKFLITKLFAVNNDGSITEIPININNLKDREFHFTFSEYESSDIEFNQKDKPVLNLNIKYFNKLETSKINKIKLTLKDDQELIFNRINNDFSFKENGFKLNIDQNTFPNFLKGHKYSIKAITIINDDQTKIELLSKSNSKASFKIPYIAYIQNSVYDPIYNKLKIKIKSNDFRINKNLDPLKYSLSFCNYNNPN